MKNFFSDKGILILLFTFLIVTSARINDLSIYSDSTRYVIWGTSVAHGKGFVDDTQPLPEYYVVNAPLLSVVLAPVMSLFPFSLYAAKVLVILISCCMIFLFYRFLLLHFDKRLSLLLTTLFSFLPLTLTISTEVLSESLFLAIVFIIFSILHRYFSGSITIKEKITVLVLLTLLPLVREIGLALTLAVILILFYESKYKELLLLFLSTSVTLGLWYFRNTSLNIPSDSQSPNIQFIFQHFVTPQGTPILIELWQRILINSKEYFQQLAGLILFSFPTNVILSPTPLHKFFTHVITNHGSVLFIITTPLLIAGIIEEWKTNDGKMRILFLLFYIFIVLLYPLLDPRFIYPLIPLLLFLYTKALQRIYTFLKVTPPIRIAITSLLVLIPALSFTITYDIVKSNVYYLLHKEKLQPSESSYESILYYTTPWEQIGEWLKNNVPAGSTLITPLKEVSIFAPHIKHQEVNRGVPTPMFEESIRSSQATYILNPFVTDNITDYEIQTTESNRFSYELLTRISRVGIYKIHYNYRTLNPPAASSTPYTNLDSLYKAIRSAIHNENYDNAITGIKQIVKQYPRTADIMYQYAIVLSLMGKDTAARTQLQNLYKLPMSAQYIPLTSAFISIMDLNLQSQKENSPNQLTDVLFETSRFYWSMGYPTQAKRIIQKAIEADTTNFIALLWALHYSIEDNKPRLQYLKTLQSLDSSNILVQSFQRILRLRDSIAISKTNQQRSQYYATLASIYNEIGLPAEAIDYAERSIAYDSTNVHRWYLLGSIHEQQNSPIAALKSYKTSTSIDSTAIEPKLAYYRLRKALQNE